MSQEGPLDKGIADIARLFLFKHSRGDVIRNSDILKFKARYHKIESLLTEVDIVLRETFGLKIKQIQKLDKEGRNLDNANSGMYTLHSLLSVKQTSQKDVEQTGLILLIVALIKLKGGRIDEQYLFQKLSDIGIQVEGRSHPFLGNIQTLISKTLVSDQYFIRAKVAINDEINNQRHEYMVGGRSITLFESADVDSFIEDIMGIVPDQ